jgi:release factor glutamine methyltransferase
MCSFKSPTIKQCLSEAQQQLAMLPEISAKLESEILLAFLLKKPRSYLYTWPEQELQAEFLEQYTQLINRRREGEPIAYITGIREFWGLEFRVTPDTLIPRPETEKLIEIALEHIPDNKSWRVADLGTGCGAIALALASERPDLVIEATDKSQNALTIAQQNKITLNISNVQFRQGHWFSAFANEQFNFIISNPPYVADLDPHLGLGDLRFEPTRALTSGNDGLKDIREIVNSAGDYLSDDGWLLLEHGFNQGDAVVNLFEKAGFSEIRCVHDYAERERATLGQWPK